MSRSRRYGPPCERCGQPTRFRPELKRVRFCSMACRRATYPSTEGICPQCQKPFSFPSWRKPSKETVGRFCSRSCALVYRHAKHRELVTPAICEYCQVTFYPLAGKANRFCTRRCRLAGNNPQTRRWESQQRLRARRRVQWDIYIATKCCQQCGEKHPAALEHHHVNPHEKAFAVANWGRYPWPKVWHEIQKCIVLCCNCHRKLEWNLAQQPLKVAA